MFFPSLLHLPPPNRPRVQSTPPSLIQNGQHLQKKKTNYSTTTTKSSAKREYFYYLDLRGRLFNLSPNEVDNPSAIARIIRVPVHLKEEKFLNFFFRRVEQNKENLEYQRKGYHWLSICAGEYNYIRAADTPVVFLDLNKGNNLNNWIIIISYNYNYN